MDQPHPNQPAALAHRVRSRTSRRSTALRACGPTPGACPVAWLGVAAMAVALVVTSIMTATAGAQLPSTSPTPDQEGAAGGGTAGLIVFLVVVGLIIGTTLVLVVRQRGRRRGGATSRP